jgi:hypothetical protein
MSNAPEQGAAGLRLRFIAPRTAEDLHEVQRLTCFEHEAESHKLKSTPQRRFPFEFLVVGARPGDASLPANSSRSPDSARA